MFGKVAYVQAITAQPGLGLWLCYSPSATESLSAFVAIILPVCDTLRVFATGLCSCRVNLPAGYFAPTLLCSAAGSFRTDLSGQGNSLFRLAVLLVRRPSALNLIMPRRKRISLRPGSCGPRRSKSGRLADLYAHPLPPRPAIGDPSRGSQE